MASILNTLSSVARNPLVQALPGIGTIAKAGTIIGNSLQKPGTTAPNTLPSIYGSSGGGGGAAQVYAPRLDIAAVNAQARSSAENAVNPYYTKTLNDFLAQQAVQKQQQTAQYETNVKNIDDTLKNTLEANALSKERTGLDASEKQTDINTANDVNQLDTGNQFEDTRLAEARAQAAAGVLGSGAGNRSTRAATTARNTTEGRQNEAFQEKRKEVELFKTRSFQDLAKSSELAGTGAEKSKKQAKFDLDSYIQNADFAEKDTRNKLEEQRLQRIADEQRNQAKLQFNNYLAKIKDPAQYEAAIRTYGGAF